MAKPKATSKARPPPKNYSETDPYWVPPSPVTGTPPKIRSKDVTTKIIGSGAIPRARMGRDQKWT